MPKSQINTDLVNQYFATNPDRVYAASDLNTLFIQKQSEWNLPPSMTSYTFLRMLLERTHLTPLRLRSRHYSSLILYSWEGKASAMSVALRMKKHTAYFSHGSAMWIHGLSENHKNIFLNNEQTPKPKSSSHLSQEAIERAFQNQQRLSKLFYTHQNTRITLVNGKHSGRLEVQRFDAPSGHPVEVTSLERTLVDITVRPRYSGGVFAVLHAFRLARGRISVAKLFETLRKLDYTYPYHQSIGFYLKHAGYTEADQLLFKQEPIKFDFYLCHNLKKPAFDPEWRLFFPKHLK